MKISAGSRLGPYQILASLGAGGMGEVWRAKDTRLDRAVAIKVLPTALSKDKRFLQRFEREARAISSLNHPHICSLYDVGEARLESPDSRSGEDSGSNGPESRASGLPLRYIVMELLEGESLADRLERGRLPLQEVLRYGRQIASALAEAHRQGITHRDLKPGNIMLTKSVAKLLDFGLAKTATQGQSRSEGGPDLPTEAKPLTVEGTIIGTLQYMAPEQIEGLEADARTDIFALGGVLYEMATGRRAFQGPSKASLIASIVSSQPEPVSHIDPKAPPAFDHVVQRCLEKEPDRRWQSAYDVACELEWIDQMGSEQGATAVAKTAVIPRRFGSIASVVTIVILATGLAVATAIDRVEEERAVSVLSLLPPEGMEILSDLALAISPDGRHLVFSAYDEDNRMTLYIRSLDEEEVRPLVNSGAGGAFPFWSPDSKHVAFFFKGKLKRVAASGGLPETICEAPRPRGGTWGIKGEIVFTANTPSGSSTLHRVSASGGEAAQLIELDDSREVSHRWPWFLPDGRHVLFTSQTTSDGSHREDESNIEVLSLESGERKRLVGANSSPQYAPSGHLLYSYDRSLIARKLDVETMTIDGPPTVLADGVEYTRLERSAFTVSREGTLVYQREPASDLGWVSLDGAVLGIEETGRGRIDAPKLSPDGTRVAFVRDDDVWVIDLERDTTSVVTSQPGAQWAHVWSADGRWIAYTSVGSGATFRRRWDGKGEPEQIYLAEPRSAFYPADWSNDGDSIVGFLVHGDDNPTEIVRLRLDSGELETMITQPFDVMNPSLSPDEDWLVALANPNGQFGVYVYSLRGDNGSWQISADLSRFPQWGPAGSTIYYLHDIAGNPLTTHPHDRPQNVTTLMAVDVSMFPEFKATPPRAVMTVKPGGAWPYALSRDPSRVLWSLAPKGDFHRPPLVVVQNWPRWMEKIH